MGMVLGCCRLVREGINSSEAEKCTRLFDRFEYMLTEDFCRYSTGVNIVYD